MSGPSIDGDPSLIDVPPSEVDEPQHTGKGLRLDG